MITEDLHYMEGGLELLDLTQPLWEQLNLQHEQLSTYYPEHFAAMNFDKRRRVLREKSVDGSVMIELVLKAADKAPIAYAISSYSNKRVGELESIFVDPVYRGQQLGAHLVNRAIEWMDNQGAVTKLVSVAVGNEKVIDFYSRFSFLPRSIILNHKA